MAYDEVTDEVTCPSCGTLFEITCQIKYGYCHGHQLKPGDEILWCDPQGRAAPLVDIDRNWGGQVLVPGAAVKACPHCQGLLPDTGVLLCDNVVKKVVFAETLGDDAIQESPPKGWFEYWTRRVAGSRNEDRLQVFCSGNRWTIAVADGAGGTSGGATAASSVADAAASFGCSPRSSEAWCSFLTDLDKQLGATGGGGQTTLVVLQIAEGFLEGASVGDTAAWIVGGSDFVDLTCAQNRKPLLGSGEAVPVPIPRRALTGRLIVGTDGLFNYVPMDKLVALSLLHPLQTAVDSLIQTARLPSGALQDDIALVLGDWAG